MLLQFFFGDEHIAASLCVAPVVEKLLLDNPGCQTLIALRAADELTQGELRVNGLTRLCSPRSSCERFLYGVKELLRHDWLMHSPHEQLPRLDPSSVERIPQNSMPCLARHRPIFTCGQTECRNGTQCVICAVAASCHQLKSLTD